MTYKYHVQAFMPMDEMMSQHTNSKKKANNYAKKFSKNYPIICINGKEVYNEWRQKNKFVLIVALKN